ncbi:MULTISPECIES: 2-oxo acid dehydrogenase subunit E2 [Staphylococcus]|uniref:2-oxo acid dehydrogenase subunit E2 n=1 Tax=Staphylococcus TaxID=1279 RepID=UPI0021A2EF8D|nr:2-oxo acid dehydrogenase subunit E2 [Staphylococcus epidermidis]MCT1513178.1 2-oxo acid dehydrogenase subunit E2 [Staphylococcus epidermidis]
MKKSQFPKYRYQTLHFLNETKNIKPIYISTDVDATNLQKIKENFEKPISNTSIIVYCISQVLKNHPEANASFINSLLSPKIVYYKKMIAKFNIDQKVNNKRFVTSGTIPDSSTKSIEEIQNYVYSYKKAQFNVSPKFKGIRTLQKLPFPIGKIIFKILMKNPKKRAELQGTFSVTSLGHNPIKNFFPITATTLTFGVGNIENKAFKVDNEILNKSILTLNLTFDHRVIDGGIASDILSEIKIYIEEMGNSYA